VVHGRRRSRPASCGRRSTACCATWSTRSKRRRRGHAAWCRSR
jgi:hypothetical protein